MAKIKFYYMTLPVESPGSSKFRVRFSYDGYDGDIYNQLVKGISNALRLEEDKETRPSSIGFHTDNGPPE